MISWLLAWLQSHQPGPWVFPAMGAIAFVETLFPPFPGDVLFVLMAGWAAGTLPSADPLLLPAISGFAGCLAASLILLLLGARLGRGRVRSFLLARVGAGRLERAERLISEHAPLILVASRFMPGIRSVLVIVAGYSGVGGWRASLYAGSSALAWYLLMAFAGRELGYGLTGIEGFMRRYEIVAWAAAAVAAAVWMRARMAGGRRSEK